MTQTKTGIRAALAAAALSLAAAPLAAQDYTTYYTVMHADEFEIDWASHYREFERLTAEVRQRLPNDRDIAYGDDPKQRLDVYYPSSDPDGLPVLVFLHGGGMREGDKEQYGYVADRFAAQGIITVVASYRLQPAHPWPAQRDDAQAVVEWVYRNIGDRGGDPGRIYLSGHSAGSRLTAELSYQNQWLLDRSLPGNLIKGAVLISGVSSVPGPVQNPPPKVVIAVGELEADGGREGKRLVNSQAVGDRYETAGAEVDFLVPKGHDHATLVASLSDENSDLFRSMLAMIGD